jgi:DNA-binding SARP family transcriptional activator/streptogramin lyase
VDFRILGPLEVVEDGRPISIRRGKELALLVYLLLHANEVVPSERLIDDLWDEQPPATAAKILHNAVSHLRKQLGEGRLITKDPGYLLRVEDDELDLNRFERLAREGRPEEALALWRGSPLLDLRDERFADEARRRLEEERLAVLERRIDADLAAGRAAELVSELEQLTASHPLRERLYGQLMLALYRAGRQGDALQAYQRARRTLNAELGLEPTPELQELERKILRQDPELAAPARADRKLGPLPFRDHLSVRAAFGTAAALLVIAAAVSLGLIFGLGEDSAPPLVAKPNSLAVVDPTRNRLVEVIPVGSTPRGVALGRDAVWVANALDGTVSHIDAKSLNLIQTIGIGAQATDVVEAAGSVWVVTGIDNTLVHIDARTGGVLEKARVSRDPSASAYAIAVGKGSLWVASGDRLLRIDPRSGRLVSGRRSLLCCGALTDVAVGAGAVWAADLGQVVVRISATTGRETGSADLGVVPTALAVGYGSVWVAVPQTGAVRRVALWRIDPQTVRVTQTTSLGASGQYLPTLGTAVGAGSVWVTNYSARTLQRIDPATGIVVSTLRFAGQPHSVAVGMNRVWVTIN